jgi:hypothetical protein
MDKQKKSNARPAAKKSQSSRPNPKPNTRANGEAKQDGEEKGKRVHRLPGKRVTNTAPTSVEAGTTFSQVTEEEHKKVQDVPLKEIFVANDIETHTDEDNKAEAQTIHSSMTPNSTFSNPKLLTQIECKNPDNNASESYIHANIPGDVVNLYEKHLTGWTHLDGKLTLTFSWPNDPYNYGEVWAIFKPAHDYNHTSTAHSSLTMNSLYPHVKLDLAATTNATLTIDRPVSAPLYNLVGSPVSWGVVTFAYYPGVLGKRDGAYISTKITTHAHWEEVSVMNPCGRSFVPFRTIRTRGKIVVDGKLQPYAFSRAVSGKTDTLDRTHTGLDHYWLSDYQGLGEERMDPNCVVLTATSRNNPPKWDGSEDYEGRCMLRFGDKQYLPEDPEFEPLVNLIFDGSGEMEGHMFNARRAVEFGNTVAAGAELFNRGRNAAREHRRIQRENAQEAGLNDSVTGSTTISTQSRSTEQDSHLSSYQGTDEAVYGDKFASMGQENSLDEIFGREFLSWYSDVDFSSTIFQDNPMLTASLLEGEKNTIQHMRFPDDMDVDDERTNVDYAIADQLGNNYTVRKFNHSLWSAFKQNFSESEARVNMRLRFTKSKYHTCSVRVIYVPTKWHGCTPSGVWGSDFDVSRVDIQEFVIGDSNEITWSQPPSFSYNGYSSAFGIVVQIFNCRLSNTVNPIVRVSGYLSYSECKVAGFQGLSRVPMYNPFDVNPIPVRGITDVTAAVGNKVFGLANSYYHELFERLITKSDTKTLTAIKAYKSYDREKFLNLENAYKVNPNKFTLITELISQLVAFDAPSLGEFFIKWYTLLDVIKNEGEIPAPYIRFAYQSVFAAMIRSGVAEKHLVDYIIRLIPKVDMTHHIVGTAESYCRKLSRVYRTTVNWTAEEKCLSYRPQYLSWSPYSCPNDSNVSMPWFAWFAPQFFANSGSWHVRFNTAPGAIATPDAIGTARRVRPDRKPFETGTNNHRHNTVGDSIQTKGSPLYMHVENPHTKPTVHTLLRGAWTTDTHYGGSGGNTFPHTQADLTFANHNDPEASLDVKPGKDFRFRNYYAFTDFCYNSKFRTFLEINGPSSAIPFAAYPYYAYTGKYRMTY